MKVEIEKVRALIAAVLTAKYEAIDKMTGEDDLAIHFGLNTVEELQVEIPAALDVLTPWRPVFNPDNQRWTIRHLDGRSWNRTTRRDGGAMPVLYKTEEGAARFADQLNARKK